MMFTPAIAAGLFNAIAKQEDIEFELFETAEYSDDYMNRHVRMAKLGANRGIVKTRSEKLTEFIRRLLYDHNRDGP